MGCVFNDAKKRDWPCGHRRCTWKGQDVWGLSFKILRQGEKLQTKAADAAKYRESVNLRDGHRGSPLYYYYSYFGVCLNIGVYLKFLMRKSTKAVTKTFLLAKSRRFSLTVRNSCCGLDAASRPT